jgi:hypothetical protein
VVKAAGARTAADPALATWVGRQSALLDDNQRLSSRDIVEAV